MPRKKGVIWSFFNDLPDDESSRLKMSRVECKYCKGNVVKSTSRLRSHLRICPNFDGALMPPLDDDDDDDGVPDFKDSKLAKDDISKGDLYHPFSRYIDHTLLKPDATPHDIAALCREAHENGFYSICVNSVHAAYARQVLDSLEKKAKRTNGHHVKVTCVVGFPSGATPSEIKALEAAHCLTAGAEEIDMVLSIGHLKSGDHAYVLRDISAVVSVCKKHNAVSKVILETALLSEAEIETASHLAISTGADFIKTSTGFSTRGASVHDVQLMARIAHPRNAQVKASGGIRSLEEAQMMIHAGATRLGTSASLAIAQAIPPPAATTTNASVAPVVSTDYNMSL
ncbi:deoxyribose-phosphate aldolase [Aphanomyces invadans]|uniref:deoxyribose-phosphate aldolase n=1 Tax=Aphanomyces invadans TaxID=157072 RepID=A0A024USE7_9STRA|nr:deoxyribose-phosphate aldolase [Aphanomyces invadans]ETW08583.1 deoxyribose-phosphate aldolase [Aphanomyces invadans]|eukprot:XP_008862388.1 deoxyribose-phosphate aldolase [Aphanomyces invadans]